MNREIREIRKNIRNLYTSNSLKMCSSNVLHSPIFQEDQRPGRNLGEPDIPRNEEGRDMCTALLPGRRRKSKGYNLSRFFGGSIRPIENLFGFRRVNLIKVYFFYVYLLDGIFYSTGEMKIL